MDTLYGTLRSGRDPLFIIPVGLGLGAIKSYRHSDAECEHSESLCTLITDKKATPRSYPSPSNMCCLMATQRQIHFTDRLLKVSHTYPLSHSHGGKEGTQPEKDRVAKPGFGMWTEPVLNTSII